MKLPRLAAKRGAKALRKMKVYLDERRVRYPVRVYRREDLGRGRESRAALVREHGTTTVLFKGDLCGVARTGELLISVRGAA